MVITEQNHLMGSYSFAYHYGLMYHDELISLMSIKQVNNVLEISRFGSRLNTNVRGGFSKLLSYVINLYNSIKVVSFCDLRYSSGKSYIKAGFKLVGIITSWSWTNRDSRFNRLTCRASNNKTEKENALAKGWIRIYDAGQAKYELILKEVI
jgi:hypothetical protein